MSKGANMRRFTWLIALSAMMAASNAHAAASIVPAFATMSSATGGTTNAGKQGTNTLNLVGSSGAVVTVSKTPKPTVTFSLTPTGAPTWNQNTTGTAGGLSGTPSIAVDAIAAKSVSAQAGVGASGSVSVKNNDGASTTLTMGAGYATGVDLSAFLINAGNGNLYLGTNGASQLALSPTGLGVIGSLSATGGFSGNASTASVLAAAPGVCSNGYAPTGINASGAALTCTQYVTPAQFQSRTFDFGVDTGTVNAFALTITPAPVLIPGVSGPTGSFQAIHQNTGPATLSINGGTPIQIIRAVGGSLQALTGGEITVGMIVQIAYDGTYFQMQTPSALTASGTTSGVVQGAFKNLKASATGTSATVTVTADAISVMDSSNNYKTLYNVSLSLAGTSTGANGLDTGTLAASTWYSEWVISNGTTAAGLLSLSATAPTLPSGYTYAARVGWMRTDGTANKYPLGFTQTGRKVQYKVAAGSNVTALPIVVSGAQTSWTAASISSLVPPTAPIFRGVAWNNVSAAGYAMAVAPNSSYATSTSSTNTPPVALNTGIYSGSVSFEFVLESTNIYYGSNGNATGVQCLGWEDNL